MRSASDLSAGRGLCIHLPATQKGNALCTERKTGGGIQEAETKRGLSEKKSGAFRTETEIAGAESGERRRERTRAPGRAAKSTRQQ